MQYPAMHGEATSW